MLAEITIIRKPGDPPELGGGPVYPDTVWPPNGLPPLPPIEGLPPGWWTKPPGTDTWPITPPDWPIVIPIPPDKPQPGLPPRPDAGLPPGGVVGGGPATPPVRPDQGLPPGGIAGHPLPPGGVIGGGPIYPAEPPVLWPPLPPDAGIAGRAVILIWVVGVGYRWLIVEGRMQPPIYTPPPAQPK
jgi:hypothetical protein